MHAGMESTARISSASAPPSGFVHEDASLFQVLRSLYAWAAALPDGGRLAPLTRRLRSLALQALQHAAGSGVAATEARQLRALDAVRDRLARFSAVVGVLEPPLVAEGTREFGLAQVRSGLPAPE